MSRFVIGFIVGFAALCGVTVAMQIPSIHRPFGGTFASCAPTDLARAGRLLHVSGRDEWVSARGDVFQVSRCPSLRDTLTAPLS
jgi:hypothetical protein